MPHDEIKIRRYQPGDSLAALTEMLHRAYAPLAKAGMRYLASHQDESTTLDRLTEANAEGFVALLGEQIVGTITLKPHDADSEIAWYARLDVMSFTQFAVEPGFQGTGLGSRLLGTIEDRARQLNARELACDTSERASDLIAMYERRGYRVVDSADWDVTNYRSVVLSRTLSPDG